VGEPSGRLRRPHRGAGGDSDRPEQRDYRALA